MQSPIQPVGCAPAGHPPSAPRACAPAPPPLLPRDALCWPPCPSLSPPGAWKPSRSYQLAAAAAGSPCWLPPGPPRTGAWPSSASPPPSARTRALHGNFLDATRKVARRRRRCRVGAAHAEGLRSVCVTWDPRSQRWAGTRGRLPRVGGVLLTASDVRLGIRPDLKATPYWPSLQGANRTLRCFLKPAALCNYHIEILE